MSTVDRALSILRLFTLEQPEWSVEEVATEIGLPTSTTYRYFKSLTDMGLLVNFVAGRYVIGPAIIELDRQTRRQDPLIVSAQPVLDRLDAECPLDAVVLLCRIYRLRVMCVEQRADRADDRGISYERGRPMPLYRGAPSKIILAHLPRRVLKRCFDQDRAEIASAGLGAEWADFLAHLRLVRRAGVAVTAGELDPGVLGISGPVFAPEGEIIASLSLVLRAGEVGEAAMGALAPLVLDCARELTDRLKAHAAASL